MTAAESQTGAGPTLASTRDGTDPVHGGHRDEAGLSRLGRYVLLNRLGEGGMGVVYVAYDEKLDRKVALKLLRSRGSQNAQLRLVREAQALARLSHPNVVQIYEIESTAEQAYLVMEFVDGVTLGAWLRERPRTRAEILAVFMAAGQGLAAAHAAGLVHRDFKPENVMIRTDGRVLVMDFGLAFSDVGRSTSKPELGDLQLDVEVSASANTSKLSEHVTATGTLMGTPAYMAPEQFLGLPTDAQTDQFGFCVTLWEALYGERPFAGRDVAAISLAVTSGGIRKPERDDLPGWLREVIERGLARDPEKRWPSMQALLDALGRDPTRRRRIGLLALGTAAVLALAFVGIRLGMQRERESIIEACEAEGRAIDADWNDERKSALEQAFAATGLDFADEAWQSTRGRLDEYARAWTELRTRVCIEARVEHTRDEASLEQVATCLDNQRAILSGFAQAWMHAERITVVRSTAAAASILPPSACTDAALLARQVQPPEASREGVQQLRIALEQTLALELASLHEPALARYQVLLGDAEALGWRPLIAEIRIAMAETQVGLGQPDAAALTLRAARNDALASGHDLALLEAAIQSVEVYGEQLARYEEASLWGDLAFALIERLELADTLKEAEFLTAVASLYNNTDEFEKALDYDRRAMSIREAKLGSDHPDIAVSLDNIAATLVALGDYDGALEHFERAMSLRATGLGAESLEVAFTLNGMGGIYMQYGDLDRALATFEEAQRMMARLLGPDHVEMAPAHNNIGVIYWQQGRLDDALAEFRHARASMEPVLGPGHPRVASAIDNIGNVLVNQGHYAEALVEHQRALEIREAALGPKHGDVASSLNNLATVYSALGDDEKAYAALVRAQAIWEPLLDPDHPYLMTVFVNLADIYLRRGETDGALPLYERALAGYERSLGPDQLYCAYPLIGIARVKLLRGELSPARTAIDHALELRTRHQAMSREIAEAQAVRAEVMWAMDEREPAVEQAKTAREGFIASGKIGEPDLEKLDAWLATRER